MVVTREYVDIPVGERSMRTFVTAPKAEGAWPGVVFYTDIFQLTESSLRWAVRLAGYGFHVAVPEIYHRVEPPDTVLGFDDAGKARGQADAESITTAEFDEDIAAAIDHLSARGEPVGASGHCTGGHLGFRAAFDARVTGTALWYPTGLHDGKLGKDTSDALQRAGEIQGELMVIFGTRDPHTPQRGRDAVSFGLNAAGTKYEWHEYDAEHAFGRDVGPRFDPEATDRAFAETVSFFRRVLR
ncbi:dienelactone hydrolase family protein [Solirubrobacter phytolaccae]|uniref:Dienelactone hydrolase family protein n=1 Tax=Solirubrobacter phytolaccae TaxID=1404360 RepID=A0A9X3N2R8_9ACTN|nr:dienelactone hydrolase family protein [Solirubrobacter phytolaccae]MDA0178663.1 dienelactone hydrolase family protein [Solirubrobacter phytolaccae]